MFAFLSLSPLTTIEKHVQKRYMFNLEQKFSLVYDKRSFETDTYVKYKYSEIDYRNLSNMLKGTI